MRDGWSGPGLLATARKLCRLQPAKTVLTTPIRDLAQLVGGRMDQLLHPHRLATEAAPMRSELFSSEQLQRHARELAGWHEVDRRPDGHALLRRLEDNAEVLSQAHELVREGVAAHRRIAPAAEWLLDNYYLVEDQIRTTRRHLPRGYSRLLPRLANGPHIGLPRVYSLAIELISHTDGRVDLADLNRFTVSYQSVAALTLGELWAIPIMLRLALTENLRRVAVRICDSHRACDAA
ncbi:MAG TPA: hypothetical protein DCS97_03025, partial [Planctomycetes bacterium]|nr:hypothetical protein [Planctomycetota bacterium]